MPGPFEPLLKPKKGEEDDAAIAATLGVGGLRADATEPFVTETQTKTIVGEVFMTIGMMLVAAVFMWLFYWSYAKEKLLFMAILSGLMLLYTLTVIGIAVSYRVKLSTMTFTYLVGASAFIGFTTLVCTVFFAVRASQRLRASESSYASRETTSYVPPAVQQYVSDGAQM